MKRLTLRLPDDLHEYIRRLSFETRESINDIILAALVREQLAKEAKLKEEKK